MFNRSYQQKAARQGGGMQSARQILEGVLLSAIEERKSARPRRPRRPNVSPAQMELAWGEPIAEPAKSGGPMTDDELLAEFNRLFPESQCPR